MKTLAICSRNQCSVKSEELESKREKEVCVCDNDKSKSETSIHPILERILLFLRIAVRVRNVAFTLLREIKINRCVIDFNFCFTERIFSDRVKNIVESL